MASLNLFRNLALSFPGTTEEPHFEKVSFRVKGKIFATYDDRTDSACIKLSAVDQSVFSSADKTAIYPVDNKWGKRGWTVIALNNVDKNLLVDALATAYCQVAPKKLAEKLKPTDNEKTSSR